MKTIKDSNGNPYLSVLEEENIVRLRMHGYDEDFPKGIYFTIDKRAISNLIEELKNYEVQQS